MKLDIELCRVILQKIEDEGGIDGMEDFPSIDGHDDHFVYYQIKKMGEAGYVKHKIHGKGSRSDYDYFTVELTFQGHDFLKQMLDDTIWSKTKSIAKKSGMSLTFETVKAIIPIAIQSLLP
ncbi:uncharacterized protein DUF2513 [Sphingobacterium allocomposti]|uniref:Uncharacterized protein DUF2513 n=1 Tax=Sphingobacterium allocomposti TaxID=415956 RepID=A0A5S5D415_9SPHI|nr:DUF2513 domain-containing protein [Sphingobacterium composti Yoo et al. 2007 non Ten et al. 2007]TYP89409.1 uncharacterized protein DUF2513 [Sphingobacterium composti Yoo et al. 2007 non Ten et al. 2007]